MFLCLEAIYQKGRQYFYSVNDVRKRLLPNEDNFFRRFDLY